MTVDPEKERLRQECRTAYEKLRAERPAKKLTQDEFCRAARISRRRLKKAYGQCAYAKLQKECGDTPNVWSTESIHEDEIMTQYGKLVRAMEHDEELPTSTDWEYNNCRPNLKNLKCNWPEMPSRFLQWATDKDEWNDALAIVSERIADTMRSDEGAKLDKDFKAVIELVEEWMPERKRRSEEAYQVALRGFLQNKKCRVEESAGDSDVDLAVNNKVGIELKKDPVLAEYDRCFGQIARHLNNYDYVLVVVLHAAHKDHFREFETNVDKVYVAHGFNVVVIRKQTVRRSKLPVMRRYINWKWQY